MVFFCCLCLDWIFCCLCLAERYPPDSSSVVDGIALVDSERKALGRACRYVLVELNELLFVAILMRHLAVLYLLSYAAVTLQGGLN